MPQQVSFTSRDKIDREIAYRPDALLLAFAASACVYCRIYDTVLTELAVQRAGRLKVLKAVLIQSLSCPSGSRSRRHRPSSSTRPGRWSCGSMELPRTGRP